MSLKKITNLKQLRRAIKNNIVWKAKPYSDQNLLKKGQYILVREDSRSSWIFAKILSTENLFVIVVQVQVDNSLSKKRIQLTKGIFDYFYLFEVVS